MKGTSPSQGCGGSRESGLTCHDEVSNVHQHQHKGKSLQGPECRVHTGAQSWLVLLDRQHVMRAGHKGAAGDTTLAAHRVHRHDGPIRSRASGSWDRGDFAGFVSRAQPVLTPCPGHFHRPTPVGQPVHRRDVSAPRTVLPSMATICAASDERRLLTHRMKQRSNCKIQGGKDPCKSVTRRDAVRQRHIAAQPVKLRLAP